MSRAYKISIAETLRRTVTAADEVCSRLELLPILSDEDTATILKAELIHRGFAESEDGSLVRTTGDTCVSVDPCSGDVAVSIVRSDEATLNVDRTVIAWEDVGPGVEATEAKVREEMQRDLEKKAVKKKDDLQKETTRQLEAALADLQPELANVVNKVTREALKAKARQLGNLIEVHEDEASGALTLKVEV